MKKSSKFPTGMFATAAIVSGFMVLIISSVFSQAHAPCVNSYSSANKVIVDTNSRAHSAKPGELPLAICNRDNQQISWLTWLFKRSDSPEFHYLDLLELISRNK